jgi:hypothetical protein
MKNTFLLIILTLSFSLQSIAQLEIQTNEKTIGKNLITGETIIGSQITFPDRIHKFQFDTINNNFTIKLRGLSKNGKWLDNKGYVIRYSLDEKKALWSQKIAFQIEDIDQFGGVTLHTSGGKSHCLDNFTGLKKWEIINSIIFTDDANKIGIGYKVQPHKNKESILEGIKLQDGLPLWQRQISREYGWNNVFYLNDSTLLISASGLHTVNIYNGTGWDYNTITGKKDYTAAAIGTGLGVVAGLLTGTYAVSTGHNLVRDVISNILVDSSSIYFASKEQIVKINKNGEIIWKQALPSDLTSKSWIFKYNDNIIMVNRGYAYMGYRQLEFGKPFIASFSISNGNQNYLNQISNNKKEIISALDKRDSTLYLIYKNHISKFSIKSGENLIDKSFNTDSNGELKYFIGEQVFIQKDSSFLSLPKLDSLKKYLYTSSGNILVLDENLEITDTIASEELYVNYLQRNNKKLIAKGNQTLIIDSKGKVFAELESSSKSTVIKNNLYNIQENSIIEIDIDKIINNAP